MAPRSDGPRPDPLAPGNITGQNPSTPERLPGWTADVESDPTGGDTDIGGRPAFLFIAGDEAAVTLDSSGSNLPASASGAPWTLSRYITLGVREVDLPNINPEPVIRGVLARGFHVWRTSDPSPTSATTQ